MDIEYFIYSSVDGHLGCFHLLVIMNSVSVNVYKCLCVHMFSVLLSVYLVELLGHISLFNFLRNCQIISQRSCTILYSKYQYTRVSVSPNPQHLLFSVFFIFAILVSMKWYLIVVSIYISPMTSSVERLLVCLFIIYISSLENTF